MNADTLGYILIISGAIAIFAMTQVISILKNDHPEVYENLGKPGERGSIEFHVTIDLLIFIIMRRHNTLKDSSLTNYADTILLAFAVSVLVSMVMLVSAN